MTDSISTKDIAAELRRRLKAQFQGVSFSVRTGTGTGSAWIHVSWTDGPGNEDVERVARPLQGVQWNPQYRRYEPSSDVVTITIRGKEVTGEPLVNGVTCHWTLSDEVKAEAAALWAEHFDGADPEQSGMRGPMLVKGHLIEDAWPSVQVRKIAELVVLAERSARSAAAPADPTELTTGARGL